MYIQQIADLERELERKDTVSLNRIIELIHQIGSGKIKRT
jgi:hypothetical protein